MEEKKEITEPAEQNKLKSRKFAVWLVWLTLSVLILAFSGIVIFLTKAGAETLVPLIEKVLGWFFAISMMYLGVNVGQKIGFAISEALSDKKEEE